MFQIKATEPKVKEKIKDSCMSARNMVNGPVRIARELYKSEFNNYLNMWFAHVLRLRIIVPTLFWFI